MKIGILPLGRNTFDVEFAEIKLAAMLAALAKTDHEVIGSRDLLFDEAATQGAIENLKTRSIDYLLILQVTFTDASMAVLAADAFACPMAIWAVPEPRIGGRLRLNAFCGLNLASHALGLNDKRFSWLYADPERDVAGDLADMFAGARISTPLKAQMIDEPSDDADAIVSALRGKRIARVGEHPVGFATSQYDAQAMENISGVRIDALELEDLFAAARSADNDEIQEVRALAEQQLGGLDDVDQEQLTNSFRLKVGLEGLRETGKYDAFAIRCWPETFTEYGGAVCGAVSMMGEKRVPCACEADAYGALTQLVLQSVSDAAVFLTDLVDVDIDDNSAVVWHCGQAPISMQNPDFPAEAIVHTNRKQPLLYQFPLKPGEFTFMRISQSGGEAKMVIGLGELLDRPMAFTGTSGVFRFNSDAGDALDKIINSGLEHHIALTYGDHRKLLRSVATKMQLPLLEI